MRVGNCLLLQGDCLEIMPKIREKSIDMILCDLPYGITVHKWDSAIPLSSLWPHYERIIKDGRVIALFACQPFTSTLVLSNREKFKHEWIWYKNIASNFIHANYQPLKQHESILIFSKGKNVYYPIREKRSPKSGMKYKYINKQGAKTQIAGQNLQNYAHRMQELRNPGTVQKFECERGLHPTQKPVALLEYLIKTYTLENQTILDNCMGSGSTLVAAVNTNRRAIGIEKEDKYFQIAIDRVTRAIEERNKQNEKM